MCQYFISFFFIQPGFLYSQTYFPGTFEIYQLHKLVKSVAVLNYSLYVFLDFETKL